MPAAPSNTPWRARENGGRHLKLTTSSLIPAAREAVFAALVDPDVLRRCIPGCESLTEAGADAYEAVVTIRLAGLKGRYAGKAVLRDRKPPESLTLVVQGKGGPGFVLGSAVIGLTEEGGGTRVTCESDVQVGGLMAAVGSRLVEAAAKMLAGDFFTQLSIVLAERRSGPSASPRDGA